MANEKLWVPLDALNMNGNRAGHGARNANSLNKPTVYWKGKKRWCGTWLPVTRTSDSITDTEAIKYLKKFRRIIESDIDIQGKVKKTNKLAKQHSGSKNIDSSLLDEPAIVYYTGHLQSVKGVGEKKGKKLFNFGFHTPEHLMNASIEELKNIPGIGDKTAEKIIEDAQRVHEKAEYL